MQEVVDGQQRLTSIYKFIIGEHYIQGECAKKILLNIFQIIWNQSQIQIWKN